MRRATIKTQAIGEALEREVSRVHAYLPSNYKVHVQINAPDPYTIVIEGDDYAGWTLEGFVIPRLASGMIFATIEEDS